MLVAPAGDSIAPLRAESSFNTPENKLEYIHLKVIIQVRFLKGGNIMKKKQQKKDERKVVLQNQIGVDNDGRLLIYRQLNRKTKSKALRTG